MKAGDFDWFCFRNTPPGRIRPAFCSRGLDERDDADPAMRDCPRSWGNWSNTPLKASSSPGVGGEFFVRLSNDREGARVRVEDGVQPLRFAEWIASQGGG